MSNIKITLRNTIGIGLIFLFSISKVSAQQAKILFDATKAEMVANADWVIDADQHNLGDNSSGAMVLGDGNESNPQRYPTPAQSGVTASTPETYWDGSLSAWAIACVKQGYEVETLPFNDSITYGDSNNPQDLSNYDVFIVDEPNIAFTSSEKAAIINFVANGGGLFMISDHNNSDRNNDGMDSPHVWDDLLNNNPIQINPFGITFDYENISPSSTNFSTNPNDSIVFGPLGTGTELDYFNGTTMTLDNTANPTATGDIFENGASTTGTTEVLFAHAFYGSGRVAAIGDSSPEDDGTGDPNDNSLYNGWTGDANGDEGMIVMNATIWLLAGNSTSPTPPNSYSTQTESACNSFVWNGNTYSSSGTYKDTISNSEGGDSIMTLNLTIHNATYSSFSASACESYVWNGNTYLASGTYKDTISNSEGCDSIMTLNLSIHSATYSSFSAAACENYVWNGNTYSSSGTYKDTISNSEGCDSIITLNLTINQPNMTIIQNGASLEAMATGASFQWLNCDNGFSAIPGATNANFTATTNGNYAVEIIQNGCVDTSACYNVNSLGINKNTVGEKSLSLYPNPSNGTINCEINLISNSNVSVGIFNELGQKILTKDYSDQTKGTHIYKIDQLKNPSSGIYFVKITTDSFSITKKLEIERN